MHHTRQEGIELHAKAIELLRRQDATVLEDIVHVRHTSQMIHEQCIVLYPMFLALHAELDWRRAS